MAVRKCYIYTRVSTAAQTEGYSLEAQQESLREYAEYRELEVVGDYCDAGKSGMSIKGRPAFREMMDDIISQKDEIAYVLVFKLSRFGRNAADILKSLQMLQDYGIDLVSVSEAIDSSTQGGRLTLAILSAVAEMEHENITTQFMAAKLQKYMGGGWYGGSVPYGYRSQDGELVLEPSEAEIVRTVFELYLKKGMGKSSVVKYLNENGYERTNEGKASVFTFSFISNLLDNPIYCGRMLYKRRKSDGSKNEDEPTLCVMGKHEPIVSEETWDAVNAKKEKRACPIRKLHEPDRVNILSGLVKCPVCGCGMLAIHSRSKNKNHGGDYKPIHSYACGNSRSQNGRVCSFRHTYNQEKLDAAVIEMVGRLQTLPEFQKAVADALGAEGSMEKAEDKLRSLRKALREKVVRKEKLGEKLDGLNVLGKDYDKKYDEIQSQLDRTYDDIDSLEADVRKAADKLEAMKQRSYSSDSIMKLLNHVVKLYSHMTCEERRELCRLFIERIDVYPENRDDGKIIKSITFLFPIWYGEAEPAITKAPDETFRYVLDCSDAELTAAEAKATYAQIKAYVLEQTGLKVSSLYIAQAKRKYGIDIGKAYNKPENPKSRVPKCPREKEEAIIDALKHFKMLKPSVEYIKEGGES